MTEQSERECAIVSQLEEDARRHLDLMTGQSLMGRDYHSGYFNGLSKAIELMKARGDHLKGNSDDR